MQQSCGFNCMSRKFKTPGFRLLCIAISEESAISAKRMVVIPNIMGKGSPA